MSPRWSASPRAPGRQCFRDRQLRRPHTPSPIGPRGHGSGGTWSEAGAILPVDGRYLICFGERSIWCAWSDDLPHWEPGADDDPVPAPAASGPLGDYLVEVGPAPIITDSGLILLLHNAARKSDDGWVSDSCGHLLISPDDPGSPVAQLNRPCLEPESYLGVAPYGLGDRCSARGLR